MTVLLDPGPDERAERFIAMLESALLARALAETGPLPYERRRALLSTFLLGTFNAASAAMACTIGEGRGVLDWEPDGQGYRLVWYAPAGLACPLARLYRQENDSWAVLVVAGVCDDPSSAMLCAEWGVSRLAA